VNLHYVQRQDGLAYSHNTINGSPINQSEEEASREKMLMDLDRAAEVEGKGTVDQYGEGVPPEKHHLCPANHWKKEGVKKCQSPPITRLQGLEERLSTIRRYNLKEGSQAPTIVQKDQSL